jgi:hypothetical protein
MVLKSPSIVTSTALFASATAATRESGESGTVFSRKRMTYILFLLAFSEQILARNGRQIDASRAAYSRSDVSPVRQRGFNVLSGQVRILSNDLINRVPVLMQAND